MASKMRVKVAMFSTGSVDVELSEDGVDVFVTPVTVQPLITDTTVFGPEVTEEQQNMLMLYACERVLAEVHQSLTKRLRQTHNEAEVVTLTAAEAKA